MTVVFDKLSFMRHLESEGTFARPQAEKLSEAFHQAVQETVATTADVARLEARIDAVDAKLVGVDAKLADVDRKLAGVDIKLTGFDTKLASFDIRLVSLEGKIEASLAKFEAVAANTKVWTVGVGVALFSALSAIRFFGH